MELQNILEIFAVVTGIVFLVLLIKENIWCWLFGILSSAALVFVMYKEHLYSESILYVFYVFVGVYGYLKWKEIGEYKIVITRTSWKNILIILILGGLLSFGVGYFFYTQTDAERPFVDASTSIFGVLATFMEAHKWLSAWIFWIIINAVSIWLYLDRELNFVSFQMVLYFLMSIMGYMQWKRNVDSYQPVLTR